MAKKMTTGAYAFLGLLAVIFVISLMPTVMGIWGPVLAAVLAVVVGFLNISEKESVKTMLASLVFAIAGGASVYTSFTALPAVGPIISALLTNIGIYFLMFGIVAAIKTSVSSGKDR